MSSIHARLERARTEVSDYLDERDRSERIVVFCHFDADGLAAGALFGRSLPRLGFDDVEVVPSRRDESAFSDAARSRLSAFDPAALIVTDLGIDRTGVLADVPTLYVDHHVPHGAPAGATVVSAHDWDPVPTSAWLAFEVLAPLAEIDDLLWIAAVGVVGDLGDKAPWPRLDEAKRRFTAKWTTEAVRLVNAARRASAFDVQTPLRILLEADHPRALSADDEHGADRLRAYREEVRREVARARKNPPVFSSDRPIALITLRSACQIHPLVAQQWRRRLDEYVVIAANTGYLSGTVAFSARTALPDADLPELFQSVDLGGFTSRRYGRGHPRASGGHLPAPLFNRMLDELGFDADAHVPVDDVGPEPDVEEEHGPTGEE